MAEEAKVTQDLLDRVMEKIEEFYFDESEDGGEALFNRFATSKHHIFDDGCDAEAAEHKLE